MKARKPKMNKRKKLQVVDAPDPPPERHGGAAKPISLQPLDFEKAIGALLSAKWPPRRTR